MMSDNKEPLAKLLAALPLQYQDWLDDLASAHTRTAEEELLWTIECTWNGRYQDLGYVPKDHQTPTTRSATQADGTASVRVRAFRPARPRPARQADEASGH